MTRWHWLGLALAALLIAWGLSGCARADEVGIASYYSGRKSEGGSRVACGGRLDPRALTAAHRRHPCGTWIEVTNLANGRSTIVRITDRGPFVRGRVIDLTPAGARAIGMGGLARVRLRVM